MVRAHSGPPEQRLLLDLKIQKVLGFEIWLQKELEDCTLKTEQCDESEVRQQRGVCFGNKANNFNCGTTSERMKGNNYNFEKNFFVKPA